MSALGRARSTTSERRAPTTDEHDRPMTLVVPGARRARLGPVGRAGGSGGSRARAGVGGLSTSERLTNYLAEGPHLGLGHTGANC